MRGGYRAFQYTESRVDLTSFSQFARDETTVMYFAAQAALSGGLGPFDRIVFGVNADDDCDWRPDTHACVLRRLLAGHMLKTVWESDDVPFLYLWHPRPSKQAEAAYLPLELYQMTASCRDPIASERGFAGEEYVPCGACAPCAARSHVVHPGASTASVA